MFAAEVLYCPHPNNRIKKIPTRKRTLCSHAEKFEGLLIILPALLLDQAFTPTNKSAVNCLIKVHLKIRHG